MWCCDASTFTEHENYQTSNLNMIYSGEHNKRQCPDHRPTLFAANSCVCVCFLPIYLVFWTSNSLEVPARVTQDFSSTFPSAVRAFIFLARRMQPFLSVVDRETELSKNPSYRDSNIKDVLETNSSWPQRLARWWVSSRPSRHDAVSSDVES